MKALLKKELAYYFNNPIGYIIVILFGVFANFLFVKDIFSVGAVSMGPFFSLVSWFLVIFIPAVAMRSISEEKRVNTLEVLLTLPLSETEIVVSKWLALVGVASVGLLLTVLLPILLSLMVKLPFIEVMIGYLGLIILSSAFISVSMLFSSLTKNQIVAFLSSVVVLFVFSVLGTDFFASTFPKFIQDFIVPFGPAYQVSSFVKGILDIRSIIYFLTFTVLFLALTIINLEKRD